MVVDQLVRGSRARNVAVDVAMLALAYAVYTGVRNAVPGHQVSAIQHGEALLRFERSLRVDPERALHAGVASHPALAGLFDYDYATLHFVVVPRCPCLAVLGGTLSRRVGGQLFGT